MVDRISQNAASHAAHQTQAPNAAELKTRAQELTQKVLPLLQSPGVHGISSLPAFSATPPKHSLTHRTTAVFNSAETTRPGDHHFSKKVPPEAKGVKEVTKKVL